jgi:AcrR family transcriptional regulator
MMPKVTEEYRRARREEIIAAALRAFGRRGFSATSMAEIIAEAGLSAGAIYGQFASKTDLVLAVATSIVGDRLLDAERLRAIDPLPSPGELVGVLMRGMLRDIKNPSLMLQVWGEAMTEPAILGVANGILDRIQGAFQLHISLWQQREHGLSEAEADAIAAEQTPLFLAASQGFIVQHAFRQGFDAEAYLTAAAKYLPR